MKASGIVAAAVVAQMAVGRWSPVPWLVPDFTLLAMLLSVLRLPGNPLAPVALASAAAMALAVHHPVQSGAAYLLAGVVAIWLAHEWDLSQARAERAVIAFCQSVAIVVALGTIPFSAAVFGWALAHAGITLACVPLLQRIMPRRAVET